MFTPLSQSHCRDLETVDWVVKRAREGGNPFSLLSPPANHSPFFRSPQIMPHAVLPIFYPLPTLGSHEWTAMGSHLALGPLPDTAQSYLGLEQASQKGSIVSSSRCIQLSDCGSAQGKGRVTAAPLGLLVTVPLKLVTQIWTVQSCLGVPGNGAHIWHKYWILAPPPSRQAEREGNLAIYSRICNTE